ncbi:MAG: UDP-N-acetyl-alpha-D-glucosamine C6 dehydratase [Syntrophaceae bacterium PtaU1.Bin231]|nr:MAG: UDP-N-acetyl-alpha-D-glucosamine C6 dehydratase [Syntrophaceae bacterium PtaU1.Bin231]
MKTLFRSSHFYMLVGLDALLVALAHLASYALRFEGDIPPWQWENLERTLPFLLAVKLVAFYGFGLYRGLWRYTGIVDLQNVLKAASAATAILALAILFLYRFQGFSRSVFILDWGMTIFLVGSVRVAARVFTTNHIGELLSFGRYKDPSRKARKRLLIIGAGDAGEKFLREILDNPRVHYRPVGFLDDDPRKKGKAIHGIPVLGPVGDIGSLPAAFDEILIAIPSARGDVMRRVVEACEQTGKRYRTLPKIGELIEGRITVNTVREVSMEDLIGREKVQLDEDRISAFLQRKRVLITGAGGSIGSELVRQICRYRPESLVLMDFSEFNLYRIEMDCRRRKVGTTVEACLADIRDRDLMMRVFARRKPHIVFHAAAYKHVPMQEIHPGEAVKANVLGTRNLVEAALLSGVAHFVLVSTDKAVRPANVMGASKRVAEMIVQSADAAGSTRFMAVRFGNVIGSSGSVIPLFQQQIAQGGPVTVTHPDITRYFMSIPEAAQLILQAGAMGEGGEIFILDMGEPVRIADMARDLIRLNGLEPDQDIAIEFIGLRPGEKLYEELITVGEGIVPTGHNKVLVLRGTPGDREALNARIDRLGEIARAPDAGRLKEALKELIPEYEPS